MFPPIPPFSGLHPLVIHFPIALLLIAPIAMVASLVFFKHFRPLQFVTLTLIAMGTVAAYVAVFTGEASEEKVDIPETATEVLGKHEDLARTTRNVFTALTAAYLILTVAPIFLKKPVPKPILIAANLIFLGVYSGGTLLVANTAHLGGRLVHEYGIHTMTPDTTPTTQPAMSKDGHDKDADHDG